MLREALKISSPLTLLSRELPRFHGESLWHSTPDPLIQQKLHLSDFSVFHLVVFVLCESFAFEMTCDFYYLPHKQQF